jgi:hypothetical protein
MLLAGTENGEMYKILPTNQFETAWTPLTKPVFSSEEDIYTIAIVNPADAYVGVTRNGIFKSINVGQPGGQVWSSINPQLGESDARVIVADPTDPTDPTILYADALGVSKSTDGVGTTWTVVLNDATSKGPPSLDIIRIAIDTNVVDPGDPTRKVLYASTYSGKLFKYSDIVDGNGWKWRELSLTP